jgi:hypothetical protein
MECITKENTMNIKMLKAAVAGLVLSVSGFANAGLISIDNISGNLYEASLTGPVTYTMTNAISSGYHAGIRVENVFANFLTSNGTYISGNSIVSINGGTDINLNYNTNLPWSGGGKDFFLNTGIAWMNSMPALNVGDMLTFTSHTFRFTTSADMTLSGAEGNSYLSQSGTTALSTFGTTATVPEPSTLAIFALGIMGLAARRFKKQ